MSGTICLCPCHFNIPGFAMLHFMPCCQTCKECGYRIENSSWREHQKFHLPYVEPELDPKFLKTLSEIPPKQKAKDISVMWAGSNDITRDADGDVTQTTYFCEGLHLNSEGRKALDEYTLENLI